MIRCRKNHLLDCDVKVHKSHFMDCDAKVSLEPLDGLG